MREYHDCSKCKWCVKFCPGNNIYCWCNSPSVLDYFAANKSVIGRSYAIFDFQKEEGDYGCHFEQKEEFEIPKTKKYYYKYKIIFVVPSDQPDRPTEEEIWEASAKSDLFDWPDEFHDPIEKGEIDPNGKFGWRTWEEK